MANRVTPARPIDHLATFSLGVWAASRAATHLGTGLHKLVERPINIIQYLYPYSYKEVRQGGPVRGEPPCCSRALTLTHYFCQGIFFAACASAVVSVGAGDACVATAVTDGEAIREIGAG